MTKPKIFTIVTSLDGQSETADKWHEPHGCLQTVINSPAPGFIRNIMLGSEGIQVRHGDHLVVVPLAVLLALVEQVQPALRPPSPAQRVEEAKHNAPLVAAAIIQEA